MSDNGASPAHGGSNLPLRGGKASLYEGGVRVPAVASWRGTLPSGAVVDELIHVVDLYTTLLTLAGASLDQPLRVDGVDVWPAIAAGRRSARSQVLLNVNRKEGAIRVGSFKLIRSYGSPPRTELFDLSRDPSEQRNLAFSRPDKVEELSARLRAYRKNAMRPWLYPTQDKPIGFRVPAVWGDESGRAFRP